MDERSGTARLVDRPGDAEGRGPTATVSRRAVEEALGGGEPVDLLLDVERVAPGDERETERIALGWEQGDLERLLATASGDEITLTFDDEELRRLLDGDVEAHGMREKLAVVSVVAGIAAAGAGTAAGAVYGGDGGSATTAPSVAAIQPSEISTGLAAQAPARATPSEVSTGIGQEPAAAPARAPASEVSSGLVQEPTVTPAEVSTGIVQHPTSTPVSADRPSSWSPSPEAVALAVGAILGLTAVGFAARTQRRRPATP